MSFDHSECLSTGSTDRPSSLTLRLSNSGFSRASVPSSVVQTGVKSFGWENSTRPAVADPVMELDPALGGLGLEIGRGGVDLHGHLMVLLTKIVLVI